MIEIRFIRMRIKGTGVSLFVKPFSGNFTFTFNKPFNKVSKLIFNLFIHLPFRLICNSLFSLLCISLLFSLLFSKLSSGPFNFVGIPFKLFKVFNNVFVIVHMLFTLSIRINITLKLMCVLIEKMASVLFKLSLMLFE